MLNFLIDMFSCSPCSPRLSSPPIPFPQVAHMPNTPSSMLFRSSAINAMSNLPHDVIDAFIKQSCEAGMDVFTNFDAHNDPRNHKQVRVWF